MGEREKKGAMLGKKQPQPRQGSGCRRQRAADGESGNLGSSSASVGYNTGVKSTCKTSSI